MKITKMLLTIMLLAGLASATAATQNDASDIKVKGPDGKILNDQDYEEAAALNTKTGATMRTIQLLNSLERAEATGSQVVEREDHPELKTILDDVTELRRQVEQRLNQSNYLTSDTYLELKLQARSLTSSFKDRSQELITVEEKPEIREAARREYGEETREERQKLRSIQRRYSQQRIQKALNKADLDADIDEETTLGDLQRIIQRNKNETSLKALIREQKVKDRIKVRKQVAVEKSGEGTIKPTPPRPRPEKTTSESSCDITGSRFTCIDESINMFREALDEPSKANTDVQSNGEASAEPQPFKPKVTFDLRNTKNNAATISEVSLKGQSGRITCDASLATVEPDGTTTVSCDLTSAMLNARLGGLDRLGGSVTYKPTAKASPGYPSTREELKLIVNDDDENGGGDDPTETTTCQTGSDSVRCDDVDVDNHDITASFTYEGEDDLDFEEASAQSNLVDDYDCDTIASSLGSYTVTCQPDQPHPAVQPSWIKGKAEFVETTRLGNTVRANRISTSFAYGEPPGANPVAADFTMSPENPTTADSITFTSTREIPNVTVDTWTWTLSGPSNFERDSPDSVTFNTLPAGTYTMRLTVETKDGRIDTATETVEVSQPDESDIPWFLPGDVQTGETVNISWDVPDEYEDTLRELRLKPLENNPYGEAFTLVKDMKTLSDGEPGEVGGATVTIPEEAPGGEYELILGTQPWNTGPTWKSDSFQLSGSDNTTTEPVEPQVNVKHESPVEAGDRPRVSWTLPDDQEGAERVISLRWDGQRHVLREGGPLDGQNDPYSQAKGIKNSVVVTIPDDAVPETTEQKAQIEVAALREGLVTQQDRWRSDTFTLSSTEGDNETSEVTMFLPDLKQGETSEVSWEVPEEYRDNLRMAKLKPEGSDGAFTVLKDLKTLSDGSPYSSMGSAEITVPEEAPSGEYEFILGTQPWNTGPTWSENTEVESDDEEGPDHASIGVNWDASTEAESAFLKEGEAMVLDDEELVLKEVGETSVVVTVGGEDQIVGIDQTEQVLGENAVYQVTLQGVN